jgi:DNA replication protein DnaC
MTCEACGDTGIVYVSITHQAVAYRNGAADVQTVAACVCAAGMRRRAFTRIDRVLPSDIVAKTYFPVNGLPRNVLLEVSDSELGSIGLPKRMRQWSLASYPVQTAPQLPAAREWVTTRPHRDLVFYGPAGTGKTGLAVGLLRALYADGRSVRFVAANEWLLQLQQTFNARAEGESELRVLEPAIAPYLLVVDDLNARRADRESKQMSPYFADVLQLVLNKRQGDDKPTILTTNLDVEDMQDYLTPTIYDRLREGEFWEFTGASNRTSKPVLPFPSGGRRSARKKR